MARPKKQPNELRDMRLAVMLMAAERADIERRADLHGMSLSDYIRARALEHDLPPHAAEQAIRAALATALLRIGVNLNQLMKHMNAGRSTPLYLPELLNEIRGHVTRLTFDESRRDRHG